MHPAKAPNTPPARRRTRLAPSPTGALHLGNARTFLVNWALARREGWEILLRIEDLDTPRVKPGVNELTVDLLEWLGMDWDLGPVVQSDDLSPYRAAMSTLARAGQGYPCTMTRSQIEAAAAAASAPQEGIHETPFPATLRPPISEAGSDFTDELTNWRFVVPECSVRFHDRFAGEQTHDPSRTVGDFLVWTMRGQPSYQLAVVVDDARQGVTHVVRGDDLLDSAARQILLYRALGLGAPPSYLHLPLVRGTDGKRLAKRHGDTRLDTFRARGVTADRVIGLMARWCGITDPDQRPTPMTIDEFKTRLDLTRIPSGPVVFTPEDARWLEQRAGL